MSYPPYQNNSYNPSYPPPQQPNPGFMPMPGMGGPPPPQGGYPSPSYPPLPGGQGASGAPSFHSGYAPSYAAPPGPPAPGQYVPPPGAPQAAYMPPPGPAPSSYGPPPGASPMHHMPPQHQPPSQPYGAPSGPYTYFMGVAIAGPPINYDPRANIEKIRKATKGFGTDETALINVISPLDAMQVEELRKKFQAEAGKSLIDVLEKETGSYFRMGLQGIVHGPLGWDAELAKESVVGPGTNETLLNEIILGRTNEDMDLLKREYQRRFNRSLEKDVKDDLSMKTERLFTMALAAQRTPNNLPVDHNLVTADVEALYKAGAGKIGTDEIEICKIMTNRSDAHLHAVTGAYHTKYKKTLTKMIKSEFSGHMKEALLYVAEGVKKGDGGVHRDAKMLEKAMAGLGTKDKQLVWRLVRAHWNRPRMEAVKAAYERKYKRSLASRVKGETSGDYRKLMLAIIG